MQRFDKEKSLQGDRNYKRIVKSYNLIITKFAILVKKQCSWLDLSSSLQPNLVSKLSTIDRSHNNVDKRGDRERFFRILLNFRSLLIFLNALAHQKPV